MLMPINYDLQKIQAIEFNDQIRKSQYTFELVNNQLKLFPIPVVHYQDLWFQYILESDRNKVYTERNGQSLITNASNVPYENPIYSKINSIGRSWIFEYALALTKEMLGYVRGKYQTVPIPGSEITLNQSDLISAATSERTALIEQMKTILGTTFGLYFKAHAFHWNVEGPDFAQYHGFLGDFYESVYGNVDPIAEHIRALDSYAPVSLSRMMELSDIEEKDSVPSALAMIEDLKTSNDRYMVHLRAGIAAAESANEPAVGNFLQDILDQHQKHGWMLRSFTK